MYNEVKEVGKVRYTLRGLRARKNKTQEEVAKSL
jgi:DNA-binding XRE family transcriptional regulator